MTAPTFTPGSELCADRSPGAASDAFLFFGKRVSCMPEHFWGRPGASMPSSAHFAHRRFRVPARSSSAPQTQPAGGGTNPEKE